MIAEQNAQQQEQQQSNEQQKEMIKVDEIIIRDLTYVLDEQIENDSNFLQLLLEYISARCGKEFKNALENLIDDQLSKGYSITELKTRLIIDRIYYDILKNRMINIELEVYASVVNSHELEKECRVCKVEVWKSANKTKRENELATQLWMMFNQYLHKKVRKFYEMLEVIKNKFNAKVEEELKKVIIEFEGNRYEIYKDSVFDAKTDDDVVELIKRKVEIFRYNSIEEYRREQEKLELKKMLVRARELEDEVKMLEKIVRKLISEEELKEKLEELEAREDSEEEKELTKEEIEYLLNNVFY